LFLLVRDVFVRAESECQAINLTGELERAVVVKLDERHGRARVHAHIESLILWKCDRHGVLQRFRRYFLAINRECAGTPLAKSRSVVLEVKSDRVFAGFQLWAFPRGALP